MRNQRVGFREAMAASRAAREAKRPPEPEYLHKTFQGKPGHPKLERLLSDGWEVQGSDPVLLGGTTLRQRIWTLRKPNPAYRSDVTAEVGAGRPAS